MQSLSADQILQIWERGQRRHPLEQALLLLQAAYPQSTQQQLANLSIGQRDAGLLRLRELTFGPQLNSVTRCPQCQEKLEFSLTVTDIQFAAPLDQVLPAGELASAAEYDFTQEDYHIRFRLPNSYDLGAIAPVEDATQATEQLLSRCLISAHYQGNAIDDIPSLPSDVLTQLSAQMVEHDPQAEVLMPLTCPNCEHSWHSLFDIVSFFWTELTTQAKQLLQEVHVLARFYGWREADILSMTTVRRRFYLDWIDRTTG